MKRGRPLKYKTAEELQSAIDAYFLACDSRTRDVVTKDGTVVEVRDPERYTISGLAYFLEFENRHALLNYKGRSEFCATILRARAKIEAQRAADLANPDIRNARGLQFDLTNNFGWVEPVARQEVDMNLKVPKAIVIKEV